MRVRATWFLRGGEARVFIESDRIFQVDDKWRTPALSEMDALDLILQIQSAIEVAKGRPAFSSD